MSILAKQTKSINHTLIYMVSTVPGKVTAQHSAHVWEIKSSLSLGEGFYLLAGEDDWEHNSGLFTNKNLLWTTSNSETLTTSDRGHLDDTDLLFFSQRKQEVQVSMKLLTVTN